MFKILLALHLLFAVFAVGPLVHAATTAARGVRTGDGAATASSARVLRRYAYASVLVVLIGMALLPVKTPDGNHAKSGEFSNTWVWLSAALWIIAVGIVLTVLVPALESVTERIANQESVVTLTGKVAAFGGVVALVFAGIVFLMVYQPGR